MIYTANSNVKSQSCLERIGGDARVGIGNHALCVHLELRGQAETVEQKVRKPVLSLLSSTLPLQERKLKELGEGWGVTVLLQGVHTPGLGVPSVAHPQLGGPLREEETPQCDPPPFKEKRKKK